MIRYDQTALKPCSSQTEVLRSDLTGGRADALRAGEGVDAAAGAESQRQD